MKEARECYAKSILVKPHNLVSNKYARIANIDNIEDLKLINWVDFNLRSNEEDRRPTPIEELTFFNSRNNLNSA